MRDPSSFALLSDPSSLPGNFSRQGHIDFFQTHLPGQGEQSGVRAIVSLLTLQSRACLDFLLSLKLLGADFTPTFGEDRLFNLSHPPSSGQERPEQPIQVCRRSVPGSVQ